MHFIYSDELGKDTVLLQFGMQEFNPLDTYRRCCSKKLVTTLRLEIKFPHVCIVCSLLYSYGYVSKRRCTGQMISFAFLCRSFSIKVDRCLTVPPGSMVGQDLQAPCQPPMSPSSLTTLSCQIQAPTSVWLTTFQIEVAGILGSLVSQFQVSDRTCSRYFGFTYRFTPKHIYFCHFFCIL